MIFSRRRGGPGRHARAADPGRTGPRHAAGRRGLDDDPADPAELADDGPADLGPGPYDIAQAPAGVERLDLGSLQIPAINGVEVRVQASPEGVVQQVVLVHGGSALQLGAFAAPRGEGIWDEVRAEIRQSLADQGVTAEDTAGDYGPELRARVRTPDGPTELRFIGIEGPRWLVQAMYQGPAAVDLTLAGPLAECLTGLVVDRGPHAMPVRDTLPLRLPRELAEQAQAAQEARAGEPAAPDVPPEMPPNGHLPGAGRPPRRRPSPGSRRT